MAADIVIHRLCELPAPERFYTGIDEVFFQSSNTKSFANEAARQTFRERWLGRYLSDDPEWAYIALTAEERVAGYLVGSIDDPALAPRFADISHFKAFKNQTALFPAHLHVNLKAPYRGVGTGARLITAFVDALQEKDITGAHVVTGRGARNVAFYNRNGFLERARWGEGQGEVVFLGREINRKTPHPHSSRQVA